MRRHKKFLVLERLTARYGCRQCCGHVAGVDLNRDETERDFGEELPLHKTRLSISQSRRRKVLSWRVFEVK